jgi:ADP-ribose pyrophosphatase YjhB (NUDIX family)
MNIAIDTTPAIGQVVVMAFEAEWQPNILWVPLDTILIIKPTSYGKKPFYKFPGGMLRAGETHCQAALRELVEETGVVASSNPKNLVELVRTKKRRHQPHSGEFDVLFYAAYSSDFSGLKNPLLGQFGDEYEESLKVRFSDITKPKHRWAIKTKSNVTASMFSPHLNLLRTAGAKIA